MTEFVEVQQLVGNRVRDSGGRTVGRVESILAEVAGPQCVIGEYHLGAEAFLSRVGVDTVRLFGFHPRPHIVRVPWKLMDLSDPKHPRVRCTADELHALQEQLPPLDEDIGPPKRLAGNH